MMYSTQATEDEKPDPVTRMTRWVDQVIGARYQKYRHDETWQPPINLYEDKANYYMVADLAGVEVQEIDLHAEHGSLLLSGRRETPAPAGTSGGLKLHLMEIDHGRFTRALRLPGDADIDSVDATYKCGYLWVRIPKR